MHMSATAIFLFAHQDDEFGVFQKLREELVAGRRVYCIYFTTGAFFGKPSAHRNLESINVLTRIGVPQENVIFAGNLLNIPDASLADNMRVGADWFARWLAQVSDIASIYIPAWEGGHHDHDALNVIATTVAQENGLLAHIRQFPLYNRYRCIGPFFRVLLPLASNGVPELTPVRWKDRVEFLALCGRYPSQTKTWIGLFPFVMIHYFIRGSQSVQPASPHRFCEPPHEQPLYYEKRGFYSWEKMAERIAAFRQRSRGNE